MLDIRKNIAIWGDSVIKGIIYDADRHKYRHTEQETIIKKISELGVAVKNNAKFGMTAPKARNLMLNALKKGIEAEVAVIELGGNDCDFNWAEIASNPEIDHEPNTTLSNFKSCITDMVTALRRYGITPILMNLPPIHSEKYFAWISKGLNAQAILSFLGDKELIYRHHESYSLAIMNLSKSLSCDLIDVREPFLLKRDYYNYLCEDGIHPNEKGHAIINQTVFDFAQAKLIQV